MIRQAVKTIISLILCLCTFVQLAHASGDFETIFETTYVVSPDAITQVNQNISIENLKSDIYVSEYAIEVGSISIEDIAVRNPDGEDIGFEISETSNTTNH